MKITDDSIRIQTQTVMQFVSEDGFYIPKYCVHKIQQHTHTHRPLLKEHEMKKKMCDEFLKIENEKEIRSEIKNSQIRVHNLIRRTCIWWNKQNKNDMKRKKNGRVNTSSLHDSLTRYTITLCIAFSFFGYRFV